MGKNDRRTINNTSLNGNRERIMDIISLNPGCNPKQIVGWLELSRSAVDHHLRRLVQEGMIKVNTAGRYRRIYCMAENVRKRGTLSYSQESVIGVLDSEEGLTQIELLSRLGLTQSTLSRCLKELEKREMIVSILECGRIKYKVNTKE